MRSKLSKKTIEEILQFDFYKQSRFKRYSELFIGVLLLALAFNIFMIPNHIVSGFSGIAVILNAVFDIDASLLLIAINISLLILAFLLLEESVAMKTLVGALLYPVLAYLTEPIVNYITLDNNDVLLAVLFGGFLTGVGSGLVLRAGYSSGGVDTVNQVFNKYFKISLGKANLIVNTIIIALGVFTFGLTRLMYSLVCLYIVSVVMDRIILGISSSKSFYIITEREKEVRTFIMEKLKRGVTAIEARGGFTNNKEKVLMCIIPTKEYFILKEAINKIDENAVLLITDVYESQGSR